MPPCEVNTVSRSNISLNRLVDCVEVAMPTAELEQLFTRIGLIALLLCE